MENILTEFVQRLGSLLQGPFGGLIGGVLSFMLLEVGIRKRRERHAIAEALAAELTNNAERIQSYITGADRTQLTLTYRTSSVVFKALVARLGELPYRNVIAVTKLYGSFNDCNRVPTSWYRRAQNAFALPINHPAKAAEIKAVKDGAGEFYERITRHMNEARELATHLRTAHVLGARSFLPRKWRPNVRGQLATPSDRNTAA